MSCYSEESCAGNVVMMSSRECCVDNLNGMSFSSDGECYNCVGMFQWLVLWCIHNIIFSQYLVGLLILLRHLREILDIQLKLDITRDHRP